MADAQLTDREAGAFAGPEHLIQVVNQFLLAVVYDVMFRHPLLRPQMMNR